VIPETSFLFSLSRLRTFLSSDCANMGPWLSARGDLMRQENRAIELSRRAALKLFGIHFTHERVDGSATAFGIWVGNEAVFGGAIPPLPDAPNTPEDEYKLKAYAFVPYVYRESYTDAAGNPGEYYVYSYMQGN
jgi:hypothetical protein